MFPGLLFYFSFDKTFLHFCISCLRNHNVCACLDISQLLSMYNFTVFIPICLIISESVLVNALSFLLVKLVSIVWPKTMRTYQEYVMHTWRVHIAVHRAKIHHRDEIFIKATDQKTTFTSPDCAQLSRILYKVYQNSRPMHA